MGVFVGFYLLSLFISLTSGHFGGRSIYGSGNTRPYRVSKTMVNNRRICTECTKQYKNNCSETFWSLYLNYSDPWLMGHQQDIHPQPWDLSIYNLHVSCFTQDLMNGTDRRKKRNLAKVNMETSARTKRSLVKRESRTPDVSGVVYINAVYFGKDFYGSCAPNPRYDYCLRNAFEDREFFVDCNGQHDCFMLGIPKWLSRCNELSDFLHIEYQCIPEQFQYHMENYLSSSDRPLSHIGYIRTPNYPDKYPSHSSFECYLEVKNYNHTKYIFTALDFHLENPLDSGCCGYDWIEFQTIVSNVIVFRERFCGYGVPGSHYKIIGSKVRMVFHSDVALQERGFWMQFEAYKNSTKVSPDVQCQYFDEYDQNIQPQLGPNIDPYYESPQCNDYYSSGSGSGGGDTGSSTTSTTTTTTHTRVRDRITNKFTLATDKPSTYKSSRSSYGTTKKGVTLLASMKPKTTPRTSTVQQSTQPSAPGGSMKGQKQSGLSTSTIGIIAGVLTALLLVAILVGTAIYCMRSRSKGNPHLENNQPSNNKFQGPSFSDPKNSKNVNQKKNKPNSYYTVELSKKPPVVDRVNKPVYHNVTGDSEPYYTGGYLEPVTSQEVLYDIIPDEAVYEELSTNIDKPNKPPKSKTKGKENGAKVGLDNPSYDKSIPGRLIRKDPPKTAVTSNPGPYLDMSGQPKTKPMRDNTARSNRDTSQIYDYVDTSVENNGTYSPMVREDNPYSHMYQCLNN